MALDVGALASQILGAMKGVFDAKWPTIRDYATNEATSLAQSLADIEAQKLTGQISQGDASILLEMQKNSTKQALLAVQGMGELLVEQAINAALGTVRDAVNKALGFVLL